MAGESTDHESVTWHSEHGMVIGPCGDDCENAVELKSTTAITNAPSRKPLEGLTVLCGNPYTPS
jgi:hypothetical protein